MERAGIRLTGIFDEQNGCYRTLDFHPVLVPLVADGLRSAGQDAQFIRLRLPDLG